MKCVYKFQYSIKQKKFSLLLPVGWKFLAVNIHDEKPNIWCECLESAERESYNFEVFGTGQEIPMSATWLATYEIGPFVFHLYKL